MGNEAHHPAADANHDFVVDDTDFEAWRRHFGEPYNVGPPVEGTSISAAANVPEPVSSLLSIVALVLAFEFHSRLPGRR